MFVQRSLVACAVLTTVTVMAGCGSSTDGKAQSDGQTSSATITSESSTSTSASTSASGPTVSPQEEAARICKAIPAADLQSIMGGAGATATVNDDVCFFRLPRGDVDSVGIFVGKQSVADKRKAKPNSPDLTIASLPAVDSGTQIIVSRSKDPNQAATVIADYADSHNVDKAREASGKLLEKIMPQLSQN